MNNTRRFMEPGMLRSFFITMLLPALSIAAIAPVAANAQNCEGLAIAYDQLQSRGTRDGYEQAQGVKNQMERECPETFARKFRGWKPQDPPSLEPVLLVNDGKRFRGGTFYIACADGGQVLTATGGNNGSPVNLQYRGAGNKAQMWALEPLGDDEHNMTMNDYWGKGFRVRNVKYGTYLDADMGGRHFNGKSVITWGLNRGGAWPNGEQQYWSFWQLEGNRYVIKNPIDAALGIRYRFLDADKGCIGGAGCKVQMWDGHGAVNQQWQLLPVLDIDQVGGRKLALKASNGKYVCADVNYGGWVIADRDQVGDWEKFRLIEVGWKQWALFSGISTYVCSKRDAGGKLLADRLAVGDWEKFTLEYVGSDSTRIRLKGSNGKYVCADQSKGNQLVADRDQPGEWETFTIVPQ